jgi:ankyrin repeat protein
MDLLEAVKQNNTQLVKDLLQFKAIDIDTQDSYGLTALLLASSRGLTEYVRLLLQAGANINLQDRFGWAPLIEASEWDRTECIRLLLQAGANPNIQTKYSWTPLMYASRNGNTECVRLLLRSGAKTDLQPSNAIIYTENHHTHNHKKIVKIFKRMIIVQLLCS